MTAEKAAMEANWKLERRKWKLERFCKREKEMERRGYKRAGGENEGRE